ncbi:MAG TPA: sodium-dependent bicarbonate transport family permease [Planctomycetaceae bacterium]|nr:sodium-dependent bicarbonate transport family permease [Planctomycetaceae bacterium]
MRFRLPNLLSNSKPAGPWRKLGACLVVLAVLIVLFDRLWAAADAEGDEESAAAAGPGENQAKGKVALLDDGNPQITILGKEDVKTSFRASPNVKVKLNGREAPFGELQAGDSVELKRDEKGTVIEVNATRVRTGIVFSTEAGKLTMTTDYIDKFPFETTGGTKITLNDKEVDLTELQAGDRVDVVTVTGKDASRISATRRPLYQEFWENFRKNLFKPLLLFFYMGFSVPLLKVAFEFPHIIYQGLTIYLLVSIGWHGGEELAELSGRVLEQALMFMVVGFTLNFFIGILAYMVLRGFVTTLRRVDAATVAAYYGSDSAGTFVTCLGVLAAANIKYAAYMPVMLAVMEIPGCLVGLYLVSRLRKQGMDQLGNMPDEPNYDPHAKPEHEIDVAHEGGHKTAHQKAVVQETRMALEEKEDENGKAVAHKPPGIFNAELLREVFLNPGLFLLFGAIIVGFVSRLQGHKVTDADDPLFVILFQGLLCLFLLEMGMTASKRLKDLKTAGWRFIVYGIVAPNLFATTGICVAHIFAQLTHQPLQLGTYCLFAVLCGAASYIAVPAVQRMAIPEASPTLPLAASLGLTFSYNVTIGIPVYIMIAQLILKTFPIG